MVSPRGKPQGRGRKFIVGPDKLIALTSLYLEQSPARAAEFEECLLRNALNSSIDKTIIFYDTSKGRPDESFMGRIASINTSVVLIEKRPTYAELIGYANTHFSGRRIIIHNADVYFDGSLLLLDQVDFKNRFYCLTRRDQTGEDGYLFANVSYSQDAWLFRSPLIAASFDIPLGVLGCDERIAWEAQHIGLWVSNPSKTIAVFHNHRSEVRTPERNNQVPGPYKKTIPSELWPPQKIPVGARVTLPAFSAIIYGEVMRYEQRGRNLGYWCRKDDWVQWPVVIDEPGCIFCEIEYAAPDCAESSRFELSVGPSGSISCNVEPTGTWDLYRTYALGNISVPERGLIFVAVKPLDIPGEGLMNLRSVRLTNRRSGVL